MKTKCLHQKFKAFRLYFLAAIIFMGLLNVVKAQTEPVIGLHHYVPGTHAFVHATIITKPGSTINDATMIIRDGTIESVGKDVKIPAGAVVHEMNGKTIYPGFIDLFTDYGVLNKPRNNSNNNNEVRGTGYWSPTISPETKSSDQLAYDEKDATQLRKDGFTSLVSFPNGDAMQGQGSHVLLNDQQPKNSILQANILQSASLEKGIHAGYGYYQEYPASLMGNIAMIRQIFMDVKWYMQAWEHYKASPNGQQKPELNSALEALIPVVQKKMPLIVKAEDEFDLARINKIADEFNLDVWIAGSGFDYRKIDDLKNTKRHVILPLNFPVKPDVVSPVTDARLSLRDLRHYEMADQNAVKLNSEGIEFSFTASSLRNKNEFLPNLRRAVSSGLDENVALAALTVNPAKWIKIDHLLGSIEKGKLANFIVTDGDVFKEGTKITQSWIAGEKFDCEPEDVVSGKWTGELIEGNQKTPLNINLSMKTRNIQGDLTIGKISGKISNAELKDKVLNISFADNNTKNGKIRLSGNLDNNEIIGSGSWADGKSFIWIAKLDKNNGQDNAGSKPKSKSVKLEPLYPEGAFGVQKPASVNKEVLVKNATIWTSSDKGVLEGYDMLVKDGKIAAIGKDLKASSGAIVIDAKNKYVTAGIVDPHAHISLSGNVNEYSQAITPEVRTEDILIDDDINEYYQLAGGVTTVCTLHGSANPIGGMCSVIKLKWGEDVNSMVVPEAPEIMKFALGENVKSPNTVRGQSSRYPQSRMGTIEIIKDAFNAAIDYRKEWEKYNRDVKTNPNLVAPRKVIKYEHLLEVLDGKSMVHCHAYRHDEILAFMKLAEEFGIKADVFIHTVEGYKVAKEMKEHGAMAIVFGDWWAYKMEAYDGTPYNAAILYNEGVVTSYHSDSQDVARRLNTEASKAMHYGDVPEQEAFKMVTLNAAKMLRLEKQIGSLEIGKDADFVIWNGSPLSTTTACEQTWIEGKKYFDIREDKVLKQRDEQQRNELVQQILSANL